MARLLEFRAALPSQCLAIGELHQVFPWFSPFLEQVLRRYQNSRAAVFVSQTYGRIPSNAALPLLIPQFVADTVTALFISSAAFWNESITDPVAFFTDQRFILPHTQKYEWNLTANFHFACDDYSASFYSSQIF